MKTRVVVIAGPTASGKSALARTLAQRVKGDVLVVDSRQVYRSMDVGTAKPTRAEQAAVKHHGIDLVEPEQTFDAAQFVAHARAVIEDAGTRGVPVILEGGTGLYLRSVLHGLMPAPPRDETLRETLRARAADVGWPALHAELETVDAVYAARIQPTDPVRITRGLEVYSLTGRPFSSFEGEHAFPESPYDVMGVLVERPKEDLARRIAQRVERMWQDGLVEETRTLIARLGAEHPLVGTINYAQAAAFLAGTMRDSHARKEMTLRTVQYAKRQRTWFKKEPSLKALAVADEAAFLVAAAAFLGR